MNVLRQYDEDDVADAWARMCARLLQPDGILVEGTCDEIGRIATWAGWVRMPCRDPSPSPCAWPGSTPPPSPRSGCPRR